MASFPGAIKTFVTRLTNDTIFPAHMNDVQNEITAVETWLGVTGSALFTTLLPNNGDILYRDHTGAINHLAKGTAGLYLKEDADQDPSWAAAGGVNSKSLPPLAWYPTDDTTGSFAARLQMTVTSDATDPQARWAEWLFDKDTNEHIVTKFTVPSNFGSAPVLTIQWMDNYVTGSCTWGVRALCVTPGDAASVRARTVAAANEVTAASKGTAYYPNSTVIPITNADSMAAGDSCILVLYRNAAAAGDTLGVDAIFYDAEFRYTAS